MTDSTMFADLLAAQKEMPALQKSAINPHFKNRYVPLEELLQTVVPILNKHNFVLLQMPDIGGSGQPCLSYELRHASGERLGSTMPLLCAKDAPQAQGSAITYARRYSLMALLGLSADVDDDAEKTRRNGKAERPAFVRPSTDPMPPCPTHRLTLIKLVKGGISKSSGKPYGAFYACDVKDCDAGRNGKSWTMFEEDWQVQLQLARGADGEPLPDEELPYE